VRTIRLRMTSRQRRDALARMPRGWRGVERGRNLAVTKPDVVRGVPSQDQAHEEKERRLAHRSASLVRSPRSALAARGDAATHHRVDGHDAHRHGDDEYRTIVVVVPKRNKREEGNEALPRRAPLLMLKRGGDRHRPGPACPHPRPPKHTSTVAGSRSSQSASLWHGRHGAPSAEQDSRTVVFRNRTRTGFAPVAIVTRTSPHPPHGSRVGGGPGFAHRVNVQWSLHGSPPCSIGGACAATTERATTTATRRRHIVRSLSPGMAAGQ
jgi:hypothetical protein